MRRKEAVVKKAKAQRTFYVWRRYSCALDWLHDSGIPVAQQRKIAAACLLAYECGRRHERADCMEKPNAIVQAPPLAAVACNAGLAGTDERQAC